MDNRELATELYNSCLDMDFMDYIETSEEDIEMLEKEIEILKNNNCNCNLTILENFIESRLNII